MKQIAIIGFGKLGSHLFYALKRTGKYEIKPVIKHSSSKFSSDDFKKCRTIFICTQDSAIASAVIDLIKNKIQLKGKYIFHTAGAYSSELLYPLKKARAFTGSFHPVQTFESYASGYNRRFKDIYIVIEGSQKSTAEGRRIVKDLGSRTVELTKEQKVLHHICCVFASNYLTAHLSQIEKISQNIIGRDGSKKGLKNGFNNRNFFSIYKPLIEQTLANIKKKGIASSLTGPIERNDIMTVRLHLDTLSKQLREVLPFYILLGIETIDLAVKKKSLSKDDAKKIMGLMNRYL